LPYLRPYLGSGDSFYDPAVGGFAGASNDVRAELFSPPYALDTDNAPKIIGVGENTDPMAVTTAAYGLSLTITWSASALDVNVTSVALVAPSTVTHGFNNNQRVVFCKITAAGPGSVTVAMPPDPRVAPPQMYMLFINNVKTYGRAWWVHLKKEGPVAAASAP
jgi:hypothetical protein